MVSRGSGFPTEVDRMKRRIAVTDEEIRGN